VLIRSPRAASAAWVSQPAVVDGPGQASTSSRTSAVIHPNGLSHSVTRH